MTFTLINEQVAILQAKSKIYTYLSGTLTRCTLKLAAGEFTFALRGGYGLIQTSVPSDYVGENKYLSVDVVKWLTALQKFNAVDKINFTLTDSALKLQAKGVGTISLGVTPLAADSQEALVLDTYISNERDKYVNANRLNLTSDVIDALNLADAFFNTQLSNKVNSIGLGKQYVIYTDRSVVLRINVQDIVSPEFLQTSTEEYIYIPTSIIKIFNLLYKFREETFFNSDYKRVYWADDNTSLILALDIKKIAIPTDEEFAAIKPKDLEKGFEASTSGLKEGLGLFNGFYDSSEWKPITIEMVESKEVSFSCKQPSAEIVKVLENTTPNISGVFQISSEALRKFVSRVEEDKIESIFFNYEEEAPGVYITAENKYEIILPILEDE